MSSAWILDIENKILSLLQAKVRPAIIKKYPDLNFTTSDVNTTTKAKFPCVYLHALPGSEVANENEGNGVNAINCAIQIEVYSNSSQSDNKRVMSQVVEAMKAMRFTVNQTPHNDNVNTTYRMICRFRRKIGSGDII